jgi:pimeloyl-ACP methyl ester carboxylesterase
MSLRPSRLEPVPEETARVARAAFRKGNLLMRIRDEIGVLYDDPMFADLYDARGQQAITPWRLALVTLFQFLENLSDQQAAEAVRRRIDLKYALGSTPSCNCWAKSQASSLAAKGLAMSSHLVSVSRSRLLVTSALAGTFGIFAAAPTHAAAPHADAAATVTVAAAASGAANGAVGTSTAAAVVAEPASDTSIRPFPKVHFSDAALQDLRRRIRDTRWPEKETVSDTSQGVQLATMRALADYWVTDYDWRKAEARLNAYPQFVTTIEGLDIHFIHVRSKHENALPIVINHGWPGSILEQIKLIDLLTNPTAHGGSAKDAFDVVVPSMPGYGFSGKPTTTGWGPERMAHAWAELMKRLGYNRYVAQGGDWGAFVVDQMGLQAPHGLLAIHTNMPATVPAEVDKALSAGAPAPDGLAPGEKRAYDQLVRTFKQVDYARLMASRPQTLYGIADSPVGLAAWLLDHNDADDQPAAAVSSALNRTSSATGELTRDEVLDNITLYWLTNSGVSASRLYWEYKGGFFNAKGVKIPVAVTVFPSEQYEAPRSWTEQAYPNLIYYHQAEKGGHFAAWEQPQLFAEELRAAFRSLR